MDYNSINKASHSKSSFIHVRGISEDNTKIDYVINVDSIEYIQKNMEGKTIIKFSGNTIDLNCEYESFIEVFLNEVNLLVHIDTCTEE